MSEAELGRTTESTEEDTGTLQIMVFVPQRLPIIYNLGVGIETGKPQVSQDASSPELPPEASKKSSRQPKKPSAKWKGSAVPANTAFIVRLMLSFDCAWSKRGNGKNYDSLDGHGAFTGTQSGLIVNYATASRVCKMCQLKNPKDNHDCRQNFTGSAKAIEAHLALKLATESDILKNNNVQLGIFCGDEDS